LILFFSYCICSAMRLCLPLICSLPLSCRRKKKCPHSTNSRNRVHRGNDRPRLRRDDNSPLFPRPPSTLATLGSRLASIVPPETRLRLFQTAGDPRSVRSFSAGNHRAKPMSSGAEAVVALDRFSFAGLAFSSFACPCNKVS